jgi:hypothetical protein
MYLSDSRNSHFASIYRSGSSKIFLGVYYLVKFHCEKLFATLVHPCNPRLGDLERPTQFLCLDCSIWPDTSQNSLRSLYWPPKTSVYLSACVLPYCRSAFNSLVLGCLSPRNYVQKLSSASWYPFVQWTFNDKLS